MELDEKLGDDHLGLTWPWNLLESILTRHAANWQTDLGWRSDFLALASRVWDSLCVPFFSSSGQWWRQQKWIWTCVLVSTQDGCCVACWASGNGSMTSGQTMSRWQMWWRPEGCLGQYWLLHPLKADTTHNIPGTKLEHSFMVYGWDYRINWRINANVQEVHNMYFHTTAQFSALWWCIIFLVFI